VFVYLPFENRQANGRLSRQTASAGGILLDAFWKCLVVRFWDKAGLSLLSGSIKNRKDRPETTQASEANGHSDFRSVNNQTVEDEAQSRRSYVRGHSWEVSDRLGY